MRLLLDTHIALWALENSRRLPAAACELLLDPANSVSYSAASVWEVALKHGLHPTRVMVTAEHFAGLCRQSGFDALPIGERHVFAAEGLSRPAGEPEHRDPFDRLLIAQAKVEGCLLLTHDSLLAGYGESCVRVV